jgi:hypothetical protein
MRFLNLFMRKNCSGNFVLCSVILVSFYCKDAKKLQYKIGFKVIKNLIQECEKYHREDAERRISGWRDLE